MLRISPSLELPGDAALQRFGILAMTGAGKSNTAAVLAEEMFEIGLPWVVIDPKGDWWGIRSSQSGKRKGLPVPVFGGLYGDVPLEPTAGKLMAETVAQKRLTCVLDVSEFESKAAQLRFLTEFAQTLLRKNREPLMVFAEEADEYLPQRVMKAEAQCVGAWSRLVKRGRFRGVFCTLITQRSAALNKDALNQIDTLIPMRTTAPRDRKAIEEWVVLHDLGRELLDSLPGLDDGEAWLWSPQKLKTMERVKFRRRSTFDSGETPTLGATSRMPAQMADVDLDELGQAIQEMAEREEQNDPDRLRRKITELQSQVRSLEKKGEQRVEEVEVKVEVPVFPEPLKQAIRDMLTGLAMDTLDRATKFSKEVEGRLNSLDADFELGLELQSDVPARTQPWTFASPKSSQPSGEAGSAVPPRGRSQGLAPGRVPVEHGDVKLVAGEVRMLQTLAQFHPVKLTRANLGTLAGFSPKGGTFRNYLNKLKRSGFVNEQNKQLAMTDAGFDVLGKDIPPAPQTAEERIQVWRNALVEGERRMLDALIEAYPEWMTREQLGERSGFTASGGTFRNYLNKLARNGLAQKNGSNVRAGEALYVG